MRRFYLVLIGFVLLCWSNIQGQDMDEINRIRNDEQYIWGYGEGDSYTKAANNALENLITKISVTVESDFKNVVTEEGDDLHEYTKSVIKTYSNTKLQNTKEIWKEIDGRNMVLRYMTRTDMDKVFEDRKTKIMQYARQGIKAEKELSIGDALRYYFWSYRLLRSHPDYKTLCMDDENELKGLLFIALESRLNSVLRNIDIGIDQVKLHEEQDKKDIILDFTYQDKPIDYIDYQYHTGTSMSALNTAKDGMGLAELAGAGKNMDRLQLFIKYDYKNKCSFDKELYDVMTNTPPPPQFSKAKHQIRLEPALQKESLAESTSKEEETFETHTEYGADSVNYGTIINDVVKAIRTNRHENIKAYFTMDGYDMYEKLIANGHVYILDIKDSLNIFEVNDEVMVRSVPMSFHYQNNNRKFIEDVVFIFNKKGKIDALSFALSDKAIYDIVSKPERWGTDEEKYQIIKFMENYKTAYCLKRLDYIESVFADNALIIIGHVLKEAEPIDGMYTRIGSNERVKYIRKTKQQYIGDLQRVFQSNEFINIHFEDNTVERTNKLEDKTYGIQIAQHYYSTNYADKGYLFLMVDLNDTTNPKIYVRSWQPEKNPDGSIIGLKDFHF
ncbi:MAG: LPP20 family lipoprotein [Bacteroidales bacterium]|nr:LPP20 family lipoprotein [Bacteroidales bacterium]